MRWIYLSPHFDDVVLSCGGMVWEQAQAGESVEVWTVCAGQPAPGALLSDFARQLHQRWQTGPEAVAARRAEDEAALDRLGVASRYWNLPDCVYRALPDGSWVVNGEDDLWVEVNPQEQPVIEQLCAWLSAGIEPGDFLISPLTLGNHVDHRLVRAAAERAARRSRCSLVYYPDYPYITRPGALDGWLNADWETLCRSVSADALTAWQAAVAEYTSQISTFWGGLEEMRAEIEAYWRDGGGNCLWKAPGGSEAEG